MPFLPFALWTAAQTAGYTDSDHDGILDIWKVQGIGPLDPKKYDIKQGRADFIVCFRLRPGMTQATIQPTLDRMKRFYSEMPHKNRDGSTGLHFVPVVLPPLDKQYNGKGYPELYDVAMPTEWRGLAHGILVENSGGGGGQADRPDWAGTGYNWWTMVHELGHQLGLPHEPLGSGIGSPFHTSLMNYDYLYQFDGDGEKVHFSTGKFASLKLHEADLDETVPFPAEDMMFLTKRPHYFTVKPKDATHCLIDWNRNGILGEKHVRADINDGYSAGYQEQSKGAPSAGAPGLAALGSVLYVVTPTSDTKDLTKPDAAHPAKLTLSKVVGDKVTRVADLGVSDVTSDVSVLAEGDRIRVAYSSKPDFWSYLTVGADGKASAETYVAGGGEPVLFATPDGTAAISRDSSGELSFIPLGPKMSVQDLKIKSTQPAGAAWNPVKKQLLVASVEDRPGQPGAIRLTAFALKDKTWTQVDTGFVGGDKSPARTSNRPIVMMYDGAVNVLCKGWYADVNQPGLNFRCRQIATGTGWWIKMMGNEWANSRSVCGVAPFGDEIAYAYRWFSGPEDNTIWAFNRASGIDKQTITDFDEVGFIFEHGLRDSLNTVRNEQWPRKGWH